jgi:flagellar basal-body rod protein FlgG
MSDIMSIVATSMRADSDALRLIGQNISNADNVAYRRQVQVARPDFAEVVSATSSPAFRSREPRLEIDVDTRPGTFKSTGEPLNVAIQGEAYFVVNTAQGDMLMRRGDFHLAPDGVLTAFSGDPVLGTEGTIRIPAGTPQIDASGTIRVGTEVVGHLRLDELTSGATLEPVADGLFAIRQGSTTSSTTARVHQGFLETGNISPVNEMVRMLQTMRHFEASQRFVRTYDEMLDKAITDLGKI